MELAQALDLVAEIPDFPEPGVLFRDLSPVFGDGAAFRAVVDALGAAVGDDVDQLVAIEARGFVLAAGVGYARGLGVTIVRKPGRLPLVAGRVDYALEYGTATLELPAGTLGVGQRVAVVDDVLATGGTVAATAALVAEAGASVARAAVVLELGALGGRANLNGLPVNSLRTL